LSVQRPTNLHNVFYPETVAVIGASPKPEKIGHALLKNIIDYGYKGKIYPINPEKEDIIGLKTLPNVQDVPEEVDLAIIAVPAPIVPEVMEDCVKKGVKGALIITSGFSEIGEEGRRLEETVLGIARKGNVRIIGPNMMGIVNTSNNLNAIFVLPKAIPGEIAFISQSGAMGNAILSLGSKLRIGFSKFVSIGNMSDLDFSDMLEYLGKDDETKVVSMYIEGLKDAGRFLRIAERVTRIKPVIVIKAGRSGAGARAITSHTGYLAGSDRIYEAAFKQARILRAHNIEELFDVAKSFVYQGGVNGKRVAIVTNSGGPGIMASDACEDEGLVVPELSQETVKKLREKLPPICSTKNPVDLVANADPSRYKFAIETVAKDSSVDCVMVILTPPDAIIPRGSTTIAEAVASLSGKIGKPIVTSWMGGVEVEEGIKVLEEKRVPNLPTPERAVKAIALMSRYGTNRDSQK
jgi:acetyl coenzyme A synthetase (ADP forming)-like protein